MDAEQVRLEMKQTRASIDRKLDLLSTRTSELADRARDAARRTTAAALMGVGVSIAFSWWKRHA